MGCEVVGKGRSQPDGVALLEVKYLLYFMFSFVISFSFVFSETRMKSRAPPDGALAAGRGGRAEGGLCEARRSARPGITRARPRPPGQNG